MTVANNYAPVVQAANGVTTVFTGSWNAISASFFDVSLLNTTTGVSTPVSQGVGASQYQVTSLTSTGWVITFNTAPASGNNVVIARATTQAQTQPYTTSRGFQGSVEEGSFDQLTAMVQELQYGLDNAITVPSGDTVENLVLPIASLRASQFLGFDSSGNVVVYAGSSGGVAVSSAMSPVVGAQTLAASWALYTASTQTFAATPAVPNLNAGDDSGNVPNTGWVQKRTETPQGRLTLTSGVPVMTADATAQSTVYYAPYVGDQVPIADGSHSCLYPFSQLTQALDSNSGHTNYHQSGKCFDFFVFLNSGTVTLGTGPAWSSSTARGTGAGTTQINQNGNGIWVNTNQISMKIDATSTLITVPAGQATYVGTMYTTANGQTGMQFKPSTTSGGTNNILGLWNAYNRVKISSTESDGSASWTYTSTTWRNLDNSASNCVRIVDGLAQSPVKGSITVLSGQSSGAAYQIGMLNTTIGGSAGSPLHNAQGNATVNTQMTMVEGWFPTLGAYQISAVENNGSGTGTCAQYGSGYTVMLIELEM